MKKTAIVVLVIFFIVLASIFGASFIFNVHKKLVDEAKDDAARQAKFINDFNSQNEPFVSERVKNITLTTDIVSGHNSRNDCWIIINKGVYDVTTYMIQHPGGSESIAIYCGQDATIPFGTKDKRPASDHSAFAKDLLDSLRVGFLGDVIGTVVVSAPIEGENGTVTAGTGTIRSLFKIGDAVETRFRVIIRESANDAARSVGYELPFSSGIVGEEPRFSGGTWWVFVDFTSKKAGWVKQDSLEPKNYLFASHPIQIASANPTAGINATLPVSPNKLTVAEVAKHKTRNDCWIIINNKVYDISTYISLHPGGSDILIAYCGRDASVAFKTKDKNPSSDHSAAAYELLRDYYVGVLGSTLPTNPPITPPVTPPVITPPVIPPPVVVPPTPALSVSCFSNRSTATTNDEITWRAIATGGAGTYKYSWSGSGGLFGAMSNVTIKYSSAGTKNAQVKVTSGTKEITKTCANSVVVTSALQPLSVSCLGTPSQVPAGGRITWRATARGGSGSFAYSWSGTDALGGTASTSSKTYSLPGIKNATISVTSGSEQVTSACNAVAVAIATTSLSLSCNSNINSATTNDPITWTGLASGGTGAYVYSWSGTDSLSGSDSTLNRTYSTAGIKTAELTVNAGGESVTKKCGSGVNVVQSGSGTHLIVVNKSGEGAVTGPGINCGADCREYIAPGSTLSLEQTPQGGSTFYGWSGACGGPRLCDLTMDSPKIVNATFATAQPSSLSVSCSPSPSEIGVGDAAAWSAQVTGGLGAYTYNWSGTDGLSGDTPIVTNVYTTAGVKNGSVEITSGSEEQTKNCGALTVGNPVAFSVSCSGTPQSAITNQPVTWNVSVGGGSGSYTYSWTGTESLGGTGTTVSKNYTTTGAKNAIVTVVSGQEQVTRACDNTVSVTEAATPIVVSCSGSPASVNVNEFATWTATASGGTGTYTYTWTGDDSLVGGVATVSKNYSSAGSKSASVTVTSGTDQITRLCGNTITVLESLPPIVASCSANPTSVSTNQNVTWSSSVSGGTGSYNYTWTGTDSLSGNTSTVTRTYTSGGVKQASLSVTSGNLSVSPACQNSVTVTAGPTIITMQEIATHNTQTNCWWYMGNQVYNISAYFGRHPGGDATMRPYCGTNAEPAYNSRNHSNNADNILAGYQIGVLGTQAVNYSAKTAASLKAAVFQGPQRPIRIETSYIVASPFHANILWEPLSYVSEYSVVRDGEIISTVKASGFIDTGLEPDTKYAYKILGRDDRGRIMVESRVISLTTKPRSDCGLDELGALTCPLEQNYPGAILRTQNIKSDGSQVLKILWRGQCRAVGTDPDGFLVDDLKC